MFFDELTMLCICERETKKLLYNIFVIIIFPMWIPNILFDVLSNSFFSNVFRDWPYLLCFWSQREWNERSFERKKKETTESLRIGGIINHRLWQPDLSWSDSHRATYTYYVQEYSSIRVRCSVYVCYIAVSKFLWITCSIIIWKERNSSCAYRSILFCMHKELYNTNTI